MPNWTNNKIICKKSIGDKLLTKVDDKYILDFNKLVPMPNTLHLVSGTLEENAIACYYLSSKKEEQKKIKEVLKNKKLDFYSNYWSKYESKINYLSSNKKQLKKEKEIFLNNNYEDNYRKFNSLEELGKEYFNNIVNYNFADWYDWRIENWGTKWNVDDDVDVSYNENDDEYKISFNTAWSAPVGIIKEFSRLCSDEEFNWEFVNEDFDGYHSLKKEDGIIYDTITNYNKDLEYA